MERRIYGEEAKRYSNMISDEKLAELSAECVLPNEIGERFVSFRGNTIYIHTENKSEYRTFKYHFCSNGELVKDFYEGDWK